MVAIEHQLEVGLADSLDDGFGLRAGAEEIARRVVVVQRLNQDRHAVRRGLHTGVLQVCFEGRFGLRAFGETGHHVDIWRPDPKGIGDGLVNRGAGVGFAKRKRREAIFAGCPTRCVEAEHCQACFLQRGVNRGRVGVVGPVAFDGVKACTVGSADGVGEGQFCPQKAEIGREFGHLSRPTGR